MSTCEIVLPDILSTSWLADLNLFYRPLIGALACTLYEQLMNVGGMRREAELEDIMAICTLSQSTFAAARTKLEQFQLLRTFEDEETGEICTLELQAPKTRDDFLSDPLLGRLLFEEIGNEGLERLSRLTAPYISSRRRKNISATMQTEAFEERWSEEKEQAMKRFTPSQENPELALFDWNGFIQGFERTFPERLRTPDNVNRIIHLGAIYGVSGKDMRKIVTKALRDRKTYIDFDYIVQALSHTKKIQKVDPSDYTVAPIVFLNSRQSGQADILTSEREVLVYLTDSKKMPNEVVNTIIEYAMKQNNGAITPAYIRAIGNNMLRSHITTREQALAWLENTSSSRRSTKKTKAPLPQSYTETDNEKASQQEIDELLALQEKILGGESHGTS